VRDGPVPAGAAVLAQIESPPLADLVRDINKFSNNVMARQLFLTLGAEAGRVPAREEDGAAAIRTWLNANGLAMPELVMENGSGLSRSERISARSLARLLVAAYRSPVMPEFVASLPVVAVDGTMKKRLAGQAIAGRAHIKGGTLQGVRTMAGYVLDKAGRMQAVVFFVNDPRAGPGVRPAQDALLQWLYDGS
jgi:D-alanyl-D-alanine carboxypeptidase/D-alanyl-D-alanine-endopeptidase (penicillin-binding protein 4)